VQARTTGELRVLVRGRRGAGDRGSAGDGDGDGESDPVGTAWEGKGEARLELVVSIVGSPARLVVLIPLQMGTLGR